MMTREVDLLRQHGINPSAQRVAVASYVLHTADHPSADEIWTRVRKSFPMISRATVYNTLNLFVNEGLLRAIALTEGRVVFDPETANHHHFIDEATGRIHDLPWDALRVSGVETLDGFDVHAYQVVLRGTKKRGGRKRGGRRRS